MMMMTRFHPLSVKMIPFRNLFLTALFMYGLWLALIVLDLKGACRLSVDKNIFSFGINVFSFISRFATASLKKF